MRVFASVVVAACTALSPTLLAQWPAFTTPNVPRNPDGTLNRTAPPPRTADGKIDFSGVWEAGAGRGGGAGRAGGGGGRAGGGAIPGAGVAPDAAAGGAAPGGGRAAGGGGAAGGGRAGGGAGRGQGPAAPAADPGTPPLATFFDIGANMAAQGGIPMQPWAAELKKKRMADNMKDNPDAHCLPIGHMQLHLHPQPRKILQTPTEVAIIYESNYGLRHIFLDGRKAPPVNDPDVQPWWYGYTVGHWEGDTLVATTTGLRDGMWLDVNGTPLTDQGKIVERFRRPTFGSMEIDITIEDPKAFTRPFTVRVNQRLTVDTDLIEFICNENERSSKHY